MIHHINFLFLITLLVPVLLLGSDSWKIYDDSQVAIVEITVDPSSLDWMYQNVESDSLHLATVHFTNAWIDDTVDSVGLRLRGNTSRDSQKKSFKLSFNTFIPRRQFYDVEKLNLNGEHNDPSIIRSKLCWDLFQEIGMTASRAAHAAVYINNEYYGLYILVEHIDDEFLQDNYSDDSGNLWKCLWPADLTYRGPDPEDYHPYYDDYRPYDLKTNVDEYDYSHLVRLIDIINNTPDDLFADSLEQILMVPEVLKYFAINVLVGGWDDYWFLMNNYYLYYEPAVDKFHWIPYDYDNTFGVDWFGVDWTSVDPYIFANIEETQGGEPGPRPLAERIMANAQYRNLYSHFLEFYRDNVYDLSLWESRFDSLKDLITLWAEDDLFRTLDYGFTMDDFNDSYYADGYFNQHVKRGIKEFVNIRNSSLVTQIKWLAVKPIVYTIDWWPKIPYPEDSIYITASAFSCIGLSDVSIQFHPGDLCVIETYPMTFLPVSQTKLVEEADRWIGAIPPLGMNGFGHFQILATDINGQAQIYPRNTSIFIKTPEIDTNKVIINEFLAKNDTTNTDNAGEYDDWIELYNPTSSDVYLSGMYLTDDPDFLVKWQFPFGGVVIGSHEFLLIWCDNDLSQSGLHANFKLDVDGEFIALVADNGVSIVDSVTYGVQSADVSYGRSPDGADLWEYFTTPTPLAPNSTASSPEEYILPQKYELLQNYPNPFNPITVIRYSLPEHSNINIIVYDVLGKQIRSLINRPQEAGYRSVVWDATDDFGKPVSAGVYLYRITAGDYSEIRKMVLIK
ncbi:MAG: CotH kinase family protein [Candidatus Marinimicrobia bacterium]|nr:CotH kinase family protein [Candidatus Neomarinimicrobiota bacterium]